MFAEDLHQTQKSRSPYDMWAAPPRLQRILEDIYSAKDRSSGWMRDGTAGDALLHELRTGDQVGGKYHHQGVVDLMKRLSKLLDDNATGVESNPAGKG